MKKMIGFGLLFLMFFLFIALGGCDKRSEKAKMVHRAVYKTAETLNNRFQIRYVGISEAGGENYYKEVGLHFELFRIISKEEGREIIVNCAEELLKEINSNPQLLPYLKPSPFTVKNIEITIYVRHPDGRIPYHPDFCVLSLQRGLLSYSTTSPEMRLEYKFYTEEESYEDALKIVQSRELNKE